MRATLIIGVLVASLASAHADPDADKHQPGAYVFVLDRSSSMRGDRLELVKSATLDVIRQLDPTDEVAIVAFADKVEIVVPLGAASRRGIRGKLGRIHAGRGSNVVSGVETALKVVTRSNFEIRRVVVVTDHDSTREVERVRMPWNVTVAAIGFNSEHREVPRLLATRGRGTSHIVEYLEMLPSTLLVAAKPIPVRKDQAVVFLVDRSGSMQRDSLQLAIELVNGGLAILQPDDVVSVIAFDTSAEVIVRPQRATNRMRIAVDTSKITSGGGTDFYPALKEARDLLAGVNAGTKIVVLISDGDSPSDDSIKLVHQMVGENISVSAVGLGKADRTLLMSIANAGKGRFYSIDDLGSLPRVFMGASSR